MSHRIMGCLGLLATVVVALTGCAQAGSNTRPTPDASFGAMPPPEKGNCPATGVVFAVGNGDAAMGLREVSVELFNCGTQPVSVNGYPALRVLDENRQPLTVDILMGTSVIAGPSEYDTKPAPVTVAPGTKAVATIMWRNLVTDPNVTATEGRYLDVAGAAGEAWQTIALTHTIDLGNTARLGVTAWGPPQPGDTATPAL